MTSTLRIKASQIRPYLKGKNPHKYMVSIALNQSMILDIFAALIRSKIEFSWDYNLPITTKGLQKITYKVLFCRPSHKEICWKLPYSRSIFPYSDFHLLTLHNAYDVITDIIQIKF